MATEKIKLRPLIDKSWDYLLGTFYTAEASTVTSNAEHLHDMMQKVFNALHVKYGEILPQKLKYEMDAVNYALARISEYSDSGAGSGDTELAMIADAFVYRFEPFLKLLEQEDAE